MGEQISGANFKLPNHCEFTEARKTDITQGFDLFAVLFTFA
jgi:hypothetical protein